MKRAKKPARKPAKRTKRPKPTRKAPAQPKRGKSKVSAAGGALAARIAAAPTLNDAKAPRARVAAWLKDVGGADAKALATLFAANKNLQRLIESLSESSAFLWEL